MKTTIETTFGKFTINATYKGDKRAPWNSVTNYNNHIVTVSHNGKRLSFEFWASIASPVIETKSQLLSAFDCMLSEALSAKDYDVDAFAIVFGYDKPSDAIRVYNACKKQLKKVERVFDGDLYALANEVMEFSENA